MTNNPTSKYTNTNKPEVGSDNWLDEVFSYHNPKDGQVGNYEAIRTGAKIFAKTITLNTVPGQDQNTALWLLREAVMTANASIALEGLI